MNKMWLLISLRKIVQEGPCTSSPFKGPLSTQPNIICTPTGSWGFASFNFPVTCS